jgi:hypothetical protein
VSPSLNPVGWLGVQVQGMAVPLHTAVVDTAVSEHSIAPFGCTAIAASIAWNNRHASESPTAVVLYAWDISKWEQEDTQSPRL